MSQHQLESIEVNSLTGKRVLTQDGREIGDLRTICLDLRSWKITSLRVRLRRALLEELTLPRPIVGTKRISIPVESVSGITDTIVLRPTMAELSERLRTDGLVDEQDDAADDEESVD